MSETPVLENQIQEEIYLSSEKASVRIKFLIRAKQILNKVSGITTIEYKVLREEEINGAVPPIVVITTKPQLLPKIITIDGITTTIEYEWGIS